MLKQNYLMAYKNRKSGPPKNSAANSPLLMFDFRNKYTCPCKKNWTLFCEIFYFLTNITYNVILTDRTIFPIPISALFPTALLPANALVSLAWLVLCV